MKDYNSTLTGTDVTSDAWITGEIELPGGTNRVGQPLIVEVVVSSLTSSGTAALIVTAYAQYATGGTATTHQVGQCTFAAAGRCSMRLRFGSDFVRFYADVDADATDCDLTISVIAGQHLVEDALPGPTS